MRAPRPWSPSTRARREGTPAPVRGGSRTAPTFGERLRGGIVSDVMSSSKAKTDQLFTKICENNSDFLRQAQDRPFGKLRTGPSASSGQALRQAQDRPFGKLRTGPSKLRTGPSASGQALRQAQDRPFGTDGSMDDGVIRNVSSGGGCC